MRSRFVAPRIGQFEAVELLRLVEAALLHPGCVNRAASFAFGRGENRIDARLESAAESMFSGQPEVLIAIVRSGEFLVVGEPELQLIVQEQPTRGPGTVRC